MLQSTLFVELTKAVTVNNDLCGWCYVSLAQRWEKGLFLSDVDDDVMVQRYILKGHCWIVGLDWQLLELLDGLATNHKENNVFNQTDLFLNIFTAYK